MSPPKKRANHHRSVSQFFSSPVKKRSKRESQSDPGFTTQCQPIPRISCQERIHYPIYNPNDPRHNPELKNRLQSAMPPESSDRKPSARPQKIAVAVSPKKSSPSKSLRQARSSLKALAGSIRSKSLFNRKEIPSFSEAEHCQPLPETSPPKSQEDLGLRRSLPVDIPNHSPTSKSASIGQPPELPSADTLESPDAAISLYGTKPPGIKNRIFGSPFLSKLVNRRSRQSRVSNELETHDGASDRASSSSDGPPEIEIRDRNFGNEDIFGLFYEANTSLDVLSNTEQPSSAHNTPSAAQTSTTLTQSATCPPFETVDGTPMESTSYGSTLANPCDASANSVSGRATFQLPSHRASSRISDSQLSLEPGMWMASKNFRASQTSVRAVSECNTEQDSTFGTDLCRTDCQADGDSDSLGNNPLLLPWLVSMGAFQNDREIKPILDCSIFSKCSEILADSAHLAQHRDSPVGGNVGKHIRMTSASDVLTPSTTEETKDAAIGYQLHPITPGSQSLDEGRKPDEWGVGQVSQTPMEKDYPTRPERKAECSQTVEQLPSSLLFLVEAIDRTSGLELDHRFNDNEEFQSPAELLPIGLSESFREEQLRSKTKLRKTDQREYASLLSEGLNAGTKSPGETGKCPIMSVSASTAMRVRLSLSDTSRHKVNSEPDPNSGIRDIGGRLNRKEGSSADSNDSSQSEPMSSTTHATTFSSISSIRDFESEKKRLDIFPSLKEMNPNESNNH
ncbi:predicted protein [Uncinocarpus reesii 1704]|uniref:Uncharacterized protein n=1 Tax=Uncinocarpus reesii (strain UAMH 1704) TaxID=336963 RepID=C4JKL8_UNCRE|nr:uncharacterized protein UREG_02175 [Uncinocarpus reesii 1704]EEP77326.1 predicted protein [Uncinocarpus reesii 1704]